MTGPRNKLLGALLALVLAGAPALAQQTLAPGDYKVPKPPTKASFCADVIEAAEACQAESAACIEAAAVCNERLRVCRESAEARSAEEPPAPEQATVCLQRLLSSGGPLDGRFDLPHRHAPVAMDSLARAPWFKDWRFWTAAVVGGTALYYAKRYIDKMGDADAEAQAEVVIVERPDGCWPPGHCKGAKE